MQGSLTLLFQRPQQPGLEILTPQSTWAPVSVYPSGTENDQFPPILVNVGDLLDHWTNGLLKSTVHRVLLPEGSKEDRYSIAYFCHPADDTELVRVPSVLTDRRHYEDVRPVNGQGVVKAMTAAEHLKSRSVNTIVTIERSSLIFST
jgi:isopenicillin N synthase-like dioxygenase